ncbi:MAG: hypothetical protein IJ240_08440 [Clostridia bacterium]|nr:hypothetical protein [Clostridia bacterium]
MELGNQLVLCYLEEDNPQRGHFRVRPLLRADGPLTPGQIAEWKEDGYIRVVPDKNEQRSFKERMRKLGALCVLDLRESGESAKIRPNRSFAPAKGEKNRFIVYSDAVRSVPEDAFFEVIPESRLSDAVTPRAYARVGGKIHGPVDPLTGRDQEGAQQLPPDHPRIFSVTLPSGSVKLFYWPEQAAAAEPEAPQAELAAPSPEQTAIDQIRALNGEVMARVREENEPEQKPVKEIVIPDDAGTPLFHAQVETDAPKRARNSLAKAVESSRKTARAASAKPAAAPKSAENARQENGQGGWEEALREAWDRAEERAAVVERLLSLPGARQAVAQRLADVQDPALAALRAQLQEVEAERLMAVMNLDKAKADEEAFQKAMLEAATAQKRTRATKLDKEIKALEEQKSVLTSERAALIAERDQMAAELGKLGSDYAREAVGQEISVRDALDRLTQALKARGLEHDRNTAAALLVFWAAHQGQEMDIVAETAEDAEDALLALREALGAVLATDARLLRGGTAPVLKTERAEGLKDGTLVRTGLRSEGRPAFRAGQSGCAALKPEQAFEPVDEEKLVAALLKNVKPLTEEAARLPEEARRALETAGTALPARSWARLNAFVAAAQGLMDGGVAAALDYGMEIYIAPRVLLAGADWKPFAHPSAALPRFLRAIGRA